jgi:hypothetical protein
MSGVVDKTKIKIEHPPTLEDGMISYRVPLEQQPNETKRKGDNDFDTYLLEFVQHVLGLYGRVGLDDYRLGGNVGGDIRHSYFVVVE